MILAILQARVSSTRLPGKVLKPLLGKAMIQRQIERVLRSRNIHKLMVATSNDSTDDPLASLCSHIGVEVYRGSLNDVLDRFYQAAKRSEPEAVVRLTGDCPLCDPKVIDDTVSFFHSGNFDYASNTIERSFPDGLDVEVFRYESLVRAQAEATSPFDREHVTPYIINNASQFALGHYIQKPNWSQLRWTVDEPQDFVFVEEVYKALHAGDPQFGYEQILDLLDERPELSRINRNV